MAGRSGSGKRQRNHRVTVRFNDREIADLRLKADRSGLSIGALIRATVLGAPPPRSIRRPSVNDKAVARLLGQLGKIGSNVNQLAHHANAGRPLGRISHSIELALRDLAELRLACLQALGRELDREPPSGNGDRGEGDWSGRDSAAPPPPP